MSSFLSFGQTTHSDAELGRAFITVKQYLQQEGLTSPNAVLQRITGRDEVFKTVVDWRKVFFLSAHLGLHAPSFKKAVASLSIVSEKDCEIQVIPTLSLQDAQIGWNNAQMNSKPTLFAAMAPTLQETGAIRDYVFKEQKKNPNRFIRFDFLNPDAAKHAQLEVQQPSRHNALYNLVKEGVAAMQLELSYTTHKVETSDFENALQYVAANASLDQLTQPVAGSSSSQYVSIAPMAATSALSKMFGQATNYFSPSTKNILNLPDDASSSKPSTRRGNFNGNIDMDFEKQLNDNLDLQNPTREPDEVKSAVTAGNMLTNALNTVRDSTNNITNSIISFSAPSAPTALVAPAPRKHNKPIPERK